MIWFCNIEEMIRTCRNYDFDDFVVVGWWNAHVYLTTLRCGLSVYIVKALEFIYLVLVHLSQLF